MAVPPRNTYEEDAIAAMFAAEAANLSFKSTAALRGGTQTGAKPDQARARRLDNFMRAARPDPQAVPPPPPPQNNSNVPAVRRDPETGLPLLYRPDLKPVNHFKNSPAAPPVARKRNSKRVGFVPPPSSPYSGHGGPPRRELSHQLPLPTQNARAGGGRSQSMVARKQQNRVPPALANRPRIGAPSSSSVAAVTAPFAGMAKSRFASERFALSVHSRVVSDLRTPSPRSAAAPISARPAAIVSPSAVAVSPPVVVISPPAAVVTPSASASVVTQTSAPQPATGPVTWTNIRESDDSCTKLA